MQDQQQDEGGTKSKPVSGFLGGAVAVLLFLFSPNLSPKDLLLTHLCEEAAKEGEVAEVQGQAGPGGGGEGVPAQLDHTQEQQSEEEEEEESPASWQEPVYNSTSKVQISIRQ